MVAQWLLRHFCQAELGNGSQSRDYARPQDEWGVSYTGPRKAIESSDTWTDWRTQCQVVEEADHYCRAQR